MENSNLDNSMAIDPAAPLAIHHARLCEALRNAKIVAKSAIANYAFQKKETKDANQLLWTVFPALENIMKILDAVGDE